MRRDVTDTPSSTSSCHVNNDTDSYQTATATVVTGLFLCISSPDIFLNISYRERLPQVMVELSVIGLGFRFRVSGLISGVRVTSKSRSNLQYRLGLAHLPIT